MLLKNGQRVTKLPKLDRLAVFELTEQYSHYDEKNKRTIKTNAFSIPAVYTRYDEKENDSVEYRWAETDTPSYDKSGNASRKYTPSKLIIRKGILLVYPSQPDLYQWLMMHPDLEQNGGKKFRLKDPVANADKVVNYEKLLFEANKLIFDGERDGLSEEQLRRVYVSTGQGPVDGVSISQIKEVLIKIAKADPAKFIEMSRSKDLEVKFLIRNAYKEKVIVYNEKDRKFRWGKNSGNPGGEIVVVPSGLHGGEFFLSWLLREDNSGVLSELDTQVNALESKEA